MSSVSGSWQPCKYGPQQGVLLHSMAGSDLGSFFSSPIHSLPSVLFAAPQLSMAGCGFPVLQFYRFREGNCSTEAVSALGDKTGQGLFPGAGSECRDCRGAVPWAGRSPGRLPGCCGSFPVPEVASGIRQRQSQRRHRGAAWLEGQREGAGSAVPGRCCRYISFWCEGAITLLKLTRLGTLKGTLFCKQ